jgi:hypothetical protein
MNSCVAAQVIVTYICQGQEVARAPKNRKNPQAGNHLSIQRRDHTLVSRLYRKHPTLSMAKLKLRR